MKIANEDNIKLDIVSLENRINSNVVVINNYNKKLESDFSDEKFGNLSTNFNKYIFSKKNGINETKLMIKELSSNKKSLNVIENNYEKIDMLIEQTERILQDKLNETNNNSKPSDTQINDKIDEYNNELIIINKEIDYEKENKDIRLNLLEKKCEVYNKLFTLYKTYIMDNMKHKIISELNIQLEKYMTIKKLQDDNKLINKNNIELDNEIDKLYNSINNSINDLNNLDNIPEKQVINKFMTEKTGIMHNKDKMIMMNDELSDIINSKKVLLTDNNIIEKDDTISLADYNKSLEDINIKITDLTVKLNSYNNLRLLYETYTNDLIELTKKNRLYKFLYDFTARDGISLLMLNNWLPVITAKINNIIEPYINKKIHLVLTNDLITMISYKSNNFDEVKSLLLYGGMEAFILDIAFKIVLSQLAILPKSNLLIIDEGISVLDKTHITNISFLFNFLKFYYNNILVISHLHDIKSDIDILLNITVNNKQSRIFYN